MRVERWRMGLVGLVVVLVLSGCAGTGASGPGTAVTVTDIASVAGKWTGLMEMQGGGDREDFVELTVDRSGAYRAVTGRTIGFLDAEGKLTVADGKLRLEGARGARAMGTLYTQPGSQERALVIVGTIPSGRGFTARLKSAGGS